MNLNKRPLWICHDLRMTNLKYLGLLREKNYKLFVEIVEIVKKRILNNLNNKPKIKDFCHDPECPANLKK